MTEAFGTAKPGREDELKIFVGLLIAQNAFGDL
jgi:hypothetical protein